MQNLFLFILKYSSFILFLLLEGIAFLLLFQNNRYHNAFVFNSSKDIIAKSYETQSGIIDYLYLDEINKTLLEENALLKAELEKVDFLEEQIYCLTDTIERLEKLQYQLIPAKVVNNSIDKKDNFLTINKGESSNVGEMMGVVDSKGIVGIVKQTSDNFSVIVSVLNVKTRVSAQFKKNKAFGNVTWNGLNPREIQLNDVPKHINVLVGDTIETSGFSTIFPEGIPIGTVTDFDIEIGSDFYNIRLSLINKIAETRRVYVISNELKSEQLKLEADEN